MATFTIIENWVSDVDGEEATFYLNHAYLGSLSFGTEDMAWTTEDRSEAIEMLEKCSAKHPSKNFELLCVG